MYLTTNWHYGPWTVVVNCEMNRTLILLTENSMSICCTGHETSHSVGLFTESWNGCNYSCGKCPISTNQIIPLHDSTLICNKITQNCFISDNQGNKHLYFSLSALLLFLCITEMLAILCFSILYSPIALSSFERNWRQTQSLSSWTTLRGKKQKFYCMMRPFH